MNEKKIIEVVVPIGDAVRGIAQLQTQLEALKKTQSENKRETDAEREAYAATQIQVKEYQAQIRALTKEVSNEIKQSKDKEGSINSLRASLSNATAAYNNLSKAERESAKGVEMQKSIRATSDELKGLENAIGDNRRNVGNYAEALEGLPGPIGNVIGGVKALSKQFLLLLANPVAAVIAAIVAALYALFKVFMSTDTGATTFASTMKALSNVFDVIIDRVWSYFKLLFSIATFDFEGIKKNATDAFGGIADAIDDAARAGWEFAQVLDDIEDRESASLIRAAKLRVEIERLKNASKDSSKPVKERIRLNDLAMKKEIELNKIEVSFANERFINERNLLASKINNAKMSTANKRRQVDEWLKLDDRTLNSFKAQNKAFADFYDQNEEGFKALQKLKADNIKIDADFAQSTRRLQTEGYKFEAELRKKNQTAVKTEIKSKYAFDRYEHERMAYELEVQTIKFIDGLKKRIKDIQQVGVSAKAFEPLMKDFESYRKIVEQNYQNMLMDNVEASRGSMETRLELLDYQMERELQTAELTEKQKLAIENKYKTIREDIKRAELASQIQATGDMLGAIGSLFEENSMEYKLFATAQAVMNTWLGVTNALGQTSGGIVAQIAGATTALITGFAAVKKIWDVDVKNPSTSSGGGGLSGGSASQMAAPLSQAVSQPQGVSSVLSGASTAQTLAGSDNMTAAVYSAIANMPQPVVSVVDINNGIQRVQVIDNLSTIKSM